MSELYMVVFKISDDYEPLHKNNVIVWEGERSCLFKDKTRAEALQERMQDLYPDTEYTILTLTVQEDSDA